MYPSLYNVESYIQMSNMEEAEECDDTGGGGVFGCLPAISEGCILKTPMMGRAIPSLFDSFTYTVMSDW